MKEKLKITEDNYKEIVLKRSIILCWILLAICFIIKIFGGNFFAIVCTNENFISVCNFVDKYYLGLIVQFISYIASLCLIISCCNFKCKKYKWFIIIPILIASWTLKTLVAYNVLSLNMILYDIIDFIVCYVCCIITYNKEQFNLKNLLKPVLFIIAIFVFSLISAVTKNIGINGNINESFLIGFIFMIDYYIMIILTYLYLKRRYKNG